jgi:wyosine [tRNA(Phe)-imidazoG37] synthetase (radical SAM superfamily)
MTTLAFGPVPSRRLGRSLGINNIPPKTCTYSCVYCQLGKTNNMLVRRKGFYEREEILREVERRVHETYLRNEKIDYLTFVPDGEPTLDINIGEEMKLLKRMGIPIAVITNASLLWLSDVREDLMEADLVSVKIDTVSQDLWKVINRPHRSLKLNEILEGVRRFTEIFDGTVISETMLIDGINYNREFEKIAEFLRSLAKLDRAYIAIPTRPPTEKWVKPAKEEALNMAFQIFSERIGSDKVEYLIGYEGNAFAYTGNVKEDLLAITAVHPMREEAVAELLRKADASWQIIDELLHDGELVRLEYEGRIYYMRKLIKNT